MSPEKSLNKPKWQEKGKDEIFFRSEQKQIQKIWSGGCLGTNADVLRFPQNQCPRGRRIAGRKGKGFWSGLFAPPHRTACQLITHFRVFSLSKADCLAGGLKRWVLPVELCTLCFSFGSCWRPVVNQRRKQVRNPFIIWFNCRFATNEARLTDRKWHRSPPPSAHPSVGSIEISQQWVMLACCMEATKTCCMEAKKRRVDSFRPMIKFHFYSKRNWARYFLNDPKHWLHSAKHKRVPLIPKINQVTR